MQVSALAAQIGCERSRLSHHAAHGAVALRGMAASTAPARCFATPNGASTNAAASTATIADTDFPGPERTNKDCYAVRFVSDCSSGVSQEAHEAGKQRMVQVGASGSTGSAERSSGRSITERRTTPSQPRPQRPQRRS